MYEKGRYTDTYFQGQSKVINKNESQPSASSSSSSSLGASRKIFIYFILFFFSSLSLCSSFCYSCFSSMCVWGVWLCVCWCVYLCLPIDTRIYFGSSRGKISIGLVHYLLHFDYALTCNYSTQRADIHYVYILYIYTIPDTIVTPRGKQLFHCA